METVKMKSGEFLVKDIDAKEIFIPGEFNEEQRMIAQTCRILWMPRFSPISIRLIRATGNL